jgi:hypothetical protein
MGFQVQLSSCALRSDIPLAKLAKSPQLAVVTGGFAGSVTTQRSPASIVPDCAAIFSPPTVHSTAKTAGRSAAHSAKVGAVPSKVADGGSSCSTP